MMTDRQTFHSRQHFCAEMLQHVLQFLREEHGEIPDDVSKEASNVVFDLSSYYSYPSFAIMGLSKDVIADFVTKAFDEITLLLVGPDPDNPELDFE